MISQQALSKRVARLEAQLGTLLERGSGGVTLTGAGGRFLPAARQLLEIADHAVAATRDVPRAPLRVDVWGEIQSPAHAVRAIALEQPGIVLELSMRRDLVGAFGALQRHEIDLAFGNVATLNQPIPPGLTAELVMTDTISALVSVHSQLAERVQITPADLAHYDIWWPMAGSSQELRSTVEQYARSLGATLVRDGANLGLEAAVERVTKDPTIIALVAATWPLAGHTDVRVVPLHPAPHYPWYAVWRDACSHPTLQPLLHALREARKTVLKL